MENSHRNYPGIYSDPELESFRISVNALINEINQLEHEKTEVEKRIYEFEFRHNRELGPLTLNILRLRRDQFLRKVKLKEMDESDYDEAQKDYRDYRENFEITRNRKLNKLSPDEQELLKIRYRKASKLCHPDLVENDFKEEAEIVFKKLKSYYDQNDLINVTIILNELEHGIFSPGNGNINDKEKLLQLYNNLQLKREQLADTVYQQKNEDPFRFIQSINDWDKYFEETKHKLEEELEKLLADE